MKKAIFTTILLAGMFFIVSAQKMQTVDILTSAQCEMCKDRLESNIGFEKGVTDVELYLDSKKLRVIFNTKKTTVDDIKNAISMLGYDADEIKADSDAYGKLPKCCKKPEDRGNTDQY